LFYALRFLSKAKPPKPTNIIVVGSAMKTAEVARLSIKNIFLSQPGIYIN
jgi:hypothetical protein